MSEEDVKIIDIISRRDCEHFGVDYNEVMGGKFTKLVPLSHRM